VNYTTPYVYNSSVTLTIKDLAEDGKISQGDHIAIVWNDVMPAGQWTVKLVYAPGGTALATIMFTI